MNILIFSIYVFLNWTHILFAWPVYVSNKQLIILIIIIIYTFGYTQNVYSTFFCIAENCFYFFQKFIIVKIIMLQNTQYILLVFMSLLKTFFKFVSFYTWYVCVICIKYLFCVYTVRIYQYNIWFNQADVKS